MAEPARKHPEYQDPRTLDPMNPIPRPIPEERRFEAANDPRVDQRAILEQQSRWGGNGFMVAVIALLVAAAAYFLLGPTSQAPAPMEPPAAAAPESTAPAPATPAPAAPEATTPTEPAPATPAPQQ